MEMMKDITFSIFLIYSLFVEHISGCASNCANCDSAKQNECYYTSCTNGFKYNTKYKDCTGACSALWSSVILSLDPDQPKFSGDDPGTADGAEVTYSCNEPFIAQGADKRTCVNGVWSHEGEELKLCALPPPPSNLEKLWQEHSIMFKAGIPVVIVCVLIFIISICLAHYIKKLKLKTHRNHVVKDAINVHGKEAHVFNQATLPIMSNFGRWESGPTPGFSKNYSNQGGNQYDSAKSLGMDYNKTYSSHTSSKIPNRRDSDIYNSRYSGITQSHDVANSYLHGSYTARVSTYGYDNHASDRLDEFRHEPRVQNHMIPRAKGLPRF